MVIKILSKRSIEIPPWLRNGVQVRHYEYITYRGCFIDMNDMHMCNHYGLIGEKMYFQLLEKQSLLKSTTDIFNLLHLRINHTKYKMLLCQISALFPLWFLLQSDFFGDNHRPKPFSFVNPQNKIHCPKFKLSMCNSVYWNDIGKTLLWRGDFQKSFSYRPQRCTKHH